MAYLFNREEPFMPSVRGTTINCKICGSAFKVEAHRALTAKYCSMECTFVGRGLSSRKRVTLTCGQCSKLFEVPVSHKDRHQFCSQACRSAAPEWRAKLSAKKSGSGNAMWRGGTSKKTDGYILKHKPDHPFAGNNGYVLQHRLVMERWLRANEPKSPFLIRLGDNLYLSPEYVVHHEDGDRKHNKISNLKCLTPSEHNRLRHGLRTTKAASDDAVQPRRRLTDPPIKESSL